MKFFRSNSHHTFISIHILLRKTFERRFCSRWSLLLVQSGTSHFGQPWNRRSFIICCHAWSELMSYMRWTDVIHEVNCCHAWGELMPCMRQRWARIRTGSGLKPILAGSGLDRTEKFLLFQCLYSEHIENFSCDPIWQICWRAVYFAINDKSSAETIL